MGLFRFSGIFPICSGMVRGFSRFVLFLFLGLSRAPTRNSPERVCDTIWTFPEKSGTPPVWKPHSLASPKTEIMVKTCNILESMTSSCTAQKRTETEGQVQIGKPPCLAALDQSLCKAKGKLGRTFKGLTCIPGLQELTQILWCPLRP